MVNLPQYFFWRKYNEYIYIYDYINPPLLSNKSVGPWHTHQESQSIRNQMSDGWSILTRLYPTVPCVLYVIYIYIYIFIYLFICVLYIRWLCRICIYIYIYMYNPCITLLPRIDLLIGHPSRCMVIEVLIRGLTACLTQTPNCNACEDGDDLWR